MPLEDLTALGYEIAIPPEGMEMMATTIQGHDHYWQLNPDGHGLTEDEIVLEATNHAKIVGKMEQAQTYFQDNYANWGTMTAAQKDGANRQAQRALANLIRHVRNDLSSEGV